MFACAFGESPDLRHLRVEMRKLSRDLIAGRTGYDALSA